MQHFSFDDWAIMSEVAVNAARDMGDPARYTAALDNRGKYLFRRRLVAEARQVFDEALRLGQEHGGGRAICKSLNSLGLVCLRTRELTEAVEFFGQAAAGFEELAELRLAALARSNIVEAYLEQGDAAHALDLAAGLAETFERLGDTASYGNIRWLLAWGEWLRGEFDAAATDIGAALSLAEEASNRMWEGFWLIEAARIHRAAGALEEAMNCCVMAASLQRQIGDTSREAQALDCTGEVYQAIGNFDDAFAFHSQALRMHEAVDDTWHAVLSLANLVSCQEARGESTSARELAARCLDLLTPFNDSRARDLRERLTHGSG